MSRTNHRDVFKPRCVGCLGLVLIALIAGFGQTPAGAFEVSGVVLDPSGAVIAGAKVVLRREGGRWEQSRTTNQKGEFRFRGLASGDYEIEALKEGCKPGILRLIVDAKPQSLLRIVLSIAEVREELAVPDRSNQVNTNPDENLNVIRLDREALKNLPVLGNDVIGSLAGLLDSSSVGSGGPTLIVD